MPPAILEAGYKLIDPGRFDPLTNDYSAAISLFKQQNVEIVTGVLPPAVFATYLNQATQQGFRPKICTMAKALLFPTTLDSLGEAATCCLPKSGGRLISPSSLSLTGQTPAQFAAQWEKETGKQWTQPLGFQHSLFEVIVDTLKRTEIIDSPKAIIEAIRTTNLHTIMGDIQWTGQPVKNVCRTRSWAASGSVFPGNSNMIC